MFSRVDFAQIITQTALELAHMEDHEEPKHSKDSLDARFASLSTSLDDAWKRLQSSEDSTEINIILDQIWKAFHDCQHCRRGVVQPDSAIEDKRWLIKHMDRFLQKMQMYGLIVGDEYIDLVSEHTLLKNSMGIVDIMQHTDGPDDTERCGSADADADRDSAVDNSVCCGRAQSLKLET